jgi:hypothetical protein
VLSADGDGTAVAHVRFDPENCLTPAPPPDPVTAGCVPAAQEYADLPAPALTVSRDGGTVTVTGRFPTYTRPAGRPAVYTGRVRDLAVTVRRSGPESAGPVPAYGQLALDGGPASALDGPGSTLVQPGD